MDPNKAKALRSIGFVIPKMCDFCVHSEFSSPGAKFGTCDVYDYEHEKHTGPKRHLTVYRYGHCEPAFFPDENRIKELGPWQHFIDRRKFPRSTRHKAKTRY